MFPPWFVLLMQAVMIITYLQFVDAMWRNAKSPEERFVIVIVAFGSFILFYIMGW